MISRGVMKCLTGFMRKECERRSSSEVGIVDRVNDLGAMVWAAAPELFYEGFNFDIVG